MEHGYRAESELKIKEKHYEELISRHRCRLQ